MILAWLACAGAVLVWPSAPPALPRLAALALAGRYRREGAPARPRVTAARVSAPGVLLLAVAAAGGVAVAAGSALGVATIVAGLTARSVVARTIAVRQASRRRAGLLAAVRLIARELDAGTPVDGALRAAAEEPEFGAAFAAAAGAAARGIPLVLPMTAAAPPRAGEEVRTLAAAVDACAGSGLPLAAVLARVADDLAARGRRAAAVRSALAGPRSSAALLALLPLVGVALGSAMGADPLGLLLGTPGGRVLCAAGVVLDAVGVLITARIVASAEAT